MAIGGEADDYYPLAFPLDLVNTNTQQCDFWWISRTKNGSLQFRIVPCDRQT